MSNSSPPNLPQLKCPHCQSEEQDMFEFLGYGAILIIGAPRYPVYLCGVCTKQFELRDADKSRTGRTGSKNT
jgi:DNA-directed RNA polymerase subunit RPC12/RpoP